MTVIMVAFQMSRSQTFTKPGAPTAGRQLVQKQKKLNCESGSEDHVKDIIFCRGCQGYILEICEILIECPSVPSYV